MTHCVMFEDESLENDSLLPVGDFLKIYRFLDTRHMVRPADLFNV